jgi:glycosyltransferase 2 family protein
LKLPVKQLLLALCAAATVYALVLLLTGGTAALVLLHRLISPTGLLAAALCVLNYVLRGLRWRLWMAQYQRPLGLLEGLRLYLAGYTFTPTPGNIGEAARGLLLARQPLGAAQSLSIFGAERLADLACLLLLTLPGLWWLLMLPTQVTWLPALAVSAGLGALLGTILFLKFSSALLARYDWLKQAWQCLRTRPLTWLALTLVAWAAQGLAVWLVCADSGLDIDIGVATGFYALAMVGGALSMLPAGLGGMEALLTGLLVAHGAVLGVAVAITVTVRLLTLWLAVAIGVVALFYSAAYQKDIRLS